MVQKNRISKALTFTLSPAAVEAIELLKRELATNNASQVVNDSIINSIKQLGYVRVEKKMNNINEAITVELVRENGEVLAKYASEQGVFTEVPQVGGKYVIRLKNNSYQTKEVVVSVDGRNVVNGEIASETDTATYLLRPNETFNLKGWRRNENEVAAFEFVDLEASYDKQIGGSGSNVGVIGVVVYNEKPKAYIPTVEWYKPHTTPWDTKPRMTWEPEDLYSYKGITISATGMDSDLLGTNMVETESMTLNSSNAATAATKGSARRSTSLETENIGTGYGEKTEMKTIEVSFDREAFPSQRITLRYATKATLKKWGVIKDNIIPEVNPFPKEKVSVPEPPNWRG